MTIQNNTYFTPGPSKIYPKLPAFVQEAMEKQIMSVSHRGLEFKDMYEGAMNGLRSLLGIPKDYYIFFFASATEIWERIAQNCIENTSFHFNNGIFGYRFVWAVQMLKKNAINYEVPYGKGFNFDAVDIPDEAELIAFTHNESSTGVMLDMKEIEKFKERYPNKLIAVDVVSSIPYPEIDFSKIDLTYFSVQKGFGLPAGLGVCIISPEAFQRSAFLQRKGLNVGTYHNFQYLNKYHLRSQTPETPNVFALFLFHKVLEDMQKTDLKQMRKDIDAKAKVVYDYFEKHKKYKPFVEEKKDRSPTMIVVRTYGESTDIVGHLKKAGMIIGGGYGDLKDQHIRIANFPSHTMKEIDCLIDEFDKI